MKEEGTVSTIVAVAACAMFLILGVIQFAQIIQWIWLNVSITVK